jgi:recombinational DNA repair ATPase RecF
LVIRIDGQSAQTGISRGQQKMLVALLRLAQAMYFSEANNRPCVLLYDDLPAELDAEHRRKIIQVIRQMRSLLEAQTQGSAQLEALLETLESEMGAHQGADVPANAEAVTDPAPVDREVQIPADAGEVDLSEAATGK